MKTSELEGLALDWAVAKAFAMDVKVFPPARWNESGFVLVKGRDGEDVRFEPSAPGNAIWQQAMREFVEDCFGTEVDVPEALI